MVAILNRGAFSLGASTIGNTLGDTGVTGSRIVLAGIGGVTLSQITGAAGGTIVISGGGAGPGGAFSAGVSGGNTAGDTGVTGTRLVLAGGSNVTLSQATDLNGGTVSVHAGGGAETQTAISGIVGSDATYTSGTVQIVGAGNITVASSTGQRVIISGSQSVQPETQTFLAGLGNSETTFTSGTVRLSELGAVTLRSTTGQQFQISVDPQSVQPETQTFVGGVAGSNATYTSGTVNIVGSGIVTVQSGTGQRVIINASQSVQPETQTFIGGVAGSDTTYSSGTVRITGVGGGVTVSSNTGQRIDISVAAPVAQSVQPGVQQIVASNASFSSGTVSISGFGDITVNTAANIIRISGPVQTAETAISGIANSQTTYTSGTVSLSELGAITIRSTTGNQFQLSVAAQTAESQSIGMSNIGNTSGTTGIASGAQVRMLFAGGNNVTLSQSLNGASGTLTISAASQTVQTQNVVDVTLSGNTAGAMALISSGTMTLAGGNNITVSQAGNAVTISGPNVGGAQTGISGLANSQTTYTSGTVSLSELGAITIRSTTGNQFQLSVNAQTGTQFSAGLSNIGNTAGDTVTVGGRVILAGGNGVTLSGSSNGVSQTITISGITQSAQPVMNLVVSNTTFSSGTVSISGFGDVTVNTAANIIRISAPAQTAQTGISGLANSQTTYTSGTVSLSELGAITIRSTTGNQFQLSVNAQTGTQFSAGISGGNTAGDTGTVAGRVVLAGGANITLSGSTNGVSETVSIVGPTQTVESQSIGMSNIGNTSGTTGIASGGQVRFVFAGGNNITLSQSLNGASGTITISAPNLGAGAMSAGVSTGGNTAGATGITGTQLVFVGTNNISLSQTTGANGGTITINNTVSAFQAGASTGGNTAGDTGVTGTRLVLVGTGPVSLSQATGANGGTVSIDAPATSSIVGVSGISLSSNGSTISIMQTTGSVFLTSFAPYDDSPMVTGQQGNGTLHIQPVRINDLQMDRIVVALQVSNATNSSGSFTLSQWAGIYTRNVSTISLISSTSVSTNFTMSGTAGSYSRIGGPRGLTIPWTMTLTENDYYIGLVSRTTSGGADVSVSQLLLSKFTNVDWSGIMGTASNASDQRLLGLGIRSATTSGIPASIAFTDLRGTGSIVLRSPVFQLRSGTI